LHLTTYGYPTITSFNNEQNTLAGQGTVLEFLVKRNTLTSLLFLVDAMLFCMLILISDLTGQTSGCYGKGGLGHFCMGHHKSRFVNYQPLRFRTQYIFGDERYQVSTGDSHHLQMLSAILSGFTQHVLRSTALLIAILAGRNLASRPVEPQHAGDW
jgi:hypothetical protein